MRFKKTVLAACACALAASGGSAMASFDSDDRKRDNRSHHSSSVSCNSTHSHGGLSVVGITADSRLICFKEQAPGSAKTVGNVTGLTTDTKLVGIDYRPATGSDGDRGDLYGLGNAGGVYVVSDQTGAATLKSRIDVALTGTSFGVDFNPTVDRLRVISDSGQNLRVNVDTGATLTDGALAYPPTAATGVVGAAYTNNDTDANTATTLFDVDSALDQLSIQSPANTGQLAATGKLTVDTGVDVGADIYSWTRGGTTIKTKGLISLSANNKSALFTVDVLQGKAREGGLFSPKNQVTGIAIPFNQK